MAVQLDPSAILAQMAEGYLKLPLVQKILFPLIFAGAVLGIIFVSKWANEPEYAVLFSDLDAANSSAVIERLKDQKIAYELRGDGSVIAVTPPSVIHELRLSLAAEGVPKAGTVGFEIFDSAELGSTTIQEMIKKTRALQGELERTISSIDAIKSARVHIVTPEKSVFAKQGQEAKASVLLNFRAGGELDGRQIRGIAHLVAGSVEGLDIKNVSIVDTYGNLLNSPEDMKKDSFDAEATRLAYQQEVEKSYAQRIEQMLIRVLGPSKVIARVSAEMDFSQYEREEESYDPGGQVLRSERSISEGIGASQRGGVPGVVSNLTDDTTLIGAQGDESSNRNESVKNYEVSRAVSKTTAPRGKLVKLSAAVLVDGTPLPKPGEEAKEFTPLDPAVLGRIEQVVRTAIGFDAARGDSVTVENIPFHVGEEMFGSLLTEKNMEDTISLWFRRVASLLALILVFLLVRPLVKFLTTPTEAEVDLQRLLPTGISELEAELEAERTKASVPAFEPAVDMSQLEELMAENSRIVKENPQQAALLIRYWLNDGRL